MWPKLTNIQPNIANKIKSYSDSMEASKLNAWIRVFSGAKVGNSNGLIMQSNVNRKLFRSVGETTSTIYGDLQSSGVLGVDWGNRTVETGVGRILRPSPIITGFNVKEGQDQISRKATLELKAFSLEQMEKIQSFFLEPGYSLYVEWGWNTGQGIKGITSTAGGTDTIVKTIADKSLSWTNLSTTRTNSDGEFDCFLGFIVGGNVSGDSENFNISVELRGAPSLPTYMQTNQGTTRIDADGKVAEARKVLSPFGTIESETTAPELRRFGKMFNDLPAFRQTIDIESLKSKAKINQFINFDEVVRKQVQNAVAPNWFNDEAIEIELTTADGAATKEIEIVKEDLFSSHRFIRMDLAVEILNKIGSLDRYEIGGKEITFQIDISNTIIGAFPFMFSTKADKLIIPTAVPDFFQYYLQTSKIEQSTGGRLIVDGKSLPPRYTADGMEIFAPYESLNKFGLKEKSGYWGYLNRLFVNFELFKSKIEQKNKNIREIFLDILNEMSSAANSFWNFQIVEGEFKENAAVAEGIINTEYNTPKKDGDIILTVIDENFIGQNPNESQAVSFTHVGVGSVFLDANIDISIPADMTNQIVMTRSGNSSNPDAPIVGIGKTSFFETTGDLFITTPPTNTVASGSGETAEQPQSAVEIKKQEIEALQKSAADKLAEREKISERGTQEERQKRIDLYRAAAAEKEAARVIQQEIQTAVQEENKAALEAQATNITANLAKLAVVPKPNVIKIAIKELNDQAELSNLNKLKTDFAIYTFDDTEYFDRLKREAFGNKGGGSLSHPLPIKYSFKILGNSGIRRGDTFNITGIPEKYAKKGIFQVTEIEHSLDGNQWFTNITGQYRQIQ